MASSSKGESSDEDLYGDIDDMYLSQSDTESIHKSQDTLMSDSQNLPDTPVPQTTSQDDSGSDMCDGEADDTNDLDLYDDLIAEEDQQKIESYQEMMKKFEEAMTLISQLESENRTLRESLNKQETSSKDIQRNFSSLLITAKGEINRKEKELNTLRKQLSNKKRTPGRYRNPRDTTTDVSSFTSIDSEFEPLCVSSPGRQKKARNGDKSPNKHHKDTDRPSRSGDNTTERKRYDRDDRDRHRRRRSKSNDKEKSDRSKKYDERGKERNSLETHSPRRKSKYESETSSPDKRLSRSEKVLNSKQSIAKDDVSGEIDKDRRKDDARDRLRNDRHREKERDSRKEKKHSRESVSEDLGKSSDKVTLKHSGEENESFETSGVKDSGKETNIKIDLREKLRLKRLSCNNKTDSLQSNEKDHSSIPSSSKRNAPDRVNALQLKTLHDLNVLTCYSTSPSSVSNSKEKECRKKRTVKGKEDLNAEKEFLEKLKISIKKNETATNKTSDDTHLGKSRDNSSKLKKEKISTREIISYSDASREASDAESVTDIDMKIASEKYFTASDISSHKSMCETPVMSEINETSLEESCGVFSSSEVDMESDNKSKDEMSIIENTEKTFVNESNEMEVEDESVNWNKSQNELLQKTDHVNDYKLAEAVSEFSAEIIPKPVMNKGAKCQNNGREKAANIPQNDTLKTVSASTQDDARGFEHQKTDVRNSFAVNSPPRQECRRTAEGKNLSLPVTIEESEPMEIQTSINENLIADSHKLQDISDKKVETDFSHKCSNLNKEHVNIDHSVKTSAEMSSSTKKKESPDTARRRSARLLSKSESSLNSTKSVVHTDNVCDTEVVMEKKSEENETIYNTSSAGETEPEMNTSGNSSIRKLQRMDSKKGKKKRVRRCVTSETISCVTSVSDSTSDIFNGISDETEELNFTVDDTETSDDNFSSESSGKLQNLVCTDKNCTIKMRHLHPKCSDEKLESHELQREKQPNTERELDKNLEKAEIDYTHQMEVENTELNELKSNYGDELLNSVNVDTELENIHAKYINKVSNGTIEVTAEESVGGSGVSSSSSSSGSDSSSCSSDSETDSDSSGIEQVNTRAKADTKTTEIDPTETIENNETGVSLEGRNTVTDTTPVSNTVGKVFESDALGMKSTVLNMDEFKANEQELQVANEDFNLLMAKQDIAKGDSKSTIEMEVTSEPKNMDRDYNKLSTEIEQNCQISLTVENNDVPGPNLNCSVICYKSNQAIQETAAEEDNECNRPHMPDSGNKKSIPEKVSKLVEKTVQQDDVNDESGLKNKDVENVQSSKLTVMECNNSEKDKTANVTNTLATGREEQKELPDSKNGKDSGRKKGNDKNASSEIESEGSFGSNIMSERTDSLESGDESEVSDSDDSSGSSNSDESTDSSSDESGTGTSWETYSSDSDSEQEDVMGEQNTDKNGIGNKNENRMRNSQNIQENLDVIYAEKTGRRGVNIEEKTLSSTTESQCFSETEKMSKIAVRQDNYLDRENDKEKSDISKKFDGRSEERSSLETHSPRRKSKYESETSSPDKIHSRSEKVLNIKIMAKDNISGEKDSLQSNEKDRSLLPSSSKRNIQGRVNALQLKTLHDLNVLTCYSTSPSSVCKDETSVIENTEKTFVNESNEMEVEDESVNGNTSQNKLLQKTDHVNDYTRAEGNSELFTKIIPNPVVKKGAKCHNDREKATDIPQDDTLKKFNDVIYAEKTGRKEVNIKEKTLSSATESQCMNETETMSKIVVRQDNYLDRENLTQDEIMSCNASQVEVDESEKNMNQDICSLEKSDVQDSMIHQNIDSDSLRNISCGPEEVTLRIKTPETVKTTINVPGPSPDRSNLLQCLLNCVQNEFKGKQTILDKSGAESVDSAVHESSKTTECHEVSCSTPVANNAEKINANSNMKTESCQGISTCSENGTANKSKEEVTSEKLKESTVTASDSDKKEHEEMMVDKEREEDIVGMNLSISSDESDSGESSSGLSTHPTDCSTCSSSGSSTDSGSETESDEEFGKEDRRKKGIIAADQNRDLKTIDKNKDVGHLKCQEMTVHNAVSEIKDVTERSNVTAKDSVVRNEEVNSIVNDVTEETIIPCKDNPYWIADELPAFLLPQESSKSSDENKGKEHKNSPLKSSPVTEASRPATPAVKFTNLSPNKNKGLSDDHEVQPKPRTTALGVISSLIEGEKQLVNVKPKIIKSLELNVSKPEKLKQPEESLKLKNKSEMSEPISSVAVKKKKNHLDLSEDIKNSSSKSSTELAGPMKKIESKKLKLESYKTSRQVGEKERHLKSKGQQHVDNNESPMSTNRNIQKGKVEAKEEKEKAKENKEKAKENKERPTLTNRHIQKGNVEAKEEKEKAKENKEKAKEKKEKNVAKESVDKPLRRSPRKKPSQLSVLDSKTNKTCRVEKKNASEPVSERKSPRKRKDDLKMKTMKTSIKNANKKSVDKEVNASKSVTSVDKQKKIDKECVVQLSKSSSLVQEGSVDLSHNSSCDNKVKGMEKKHEDMETNDKAVKKNSVERVHEKTKKTADTTSVVVKKSSKGEGSNSKQLPIEKDSNLAKCHFRDTTRELSEKIMKLKVEQNMLKKELAEKQRREKDSLKLKINLTKPYDLKSSKDTKENMTKGKAPVPGSSKTGKTQPLKVAKATNGHDDLKSKTGITKTGSLNKNENLTFEEKLSDYEGHLSKSKSVSIKSKKSVVDPSMSLTVQTASLKTFTIPKVRTVRKGHDHRQKVAKVSNSKSESSSIPKKSSSYLSSTSGKRPKESKTNHVVGNKNNGSKSDIGKSSRQQTKPHKRYIISDSESSISNTDSESEPDSSKSEDSDAIVKAIFGSSDSSGNSKKSVTIADLRQTRSSEHTENIVKDTSQDDAMQHNKNEVFNKGEEYETNSSNEKQEKSKNKDIGMQRCETADKTEESKHIHTPQSKTSESQGKKNDPIKDSKKVDTKTDDSHKEDNVKKKYTIQKSNKGRTKEEENDKGENVKKIHTTQKSHKGRTKEEENDQGENVKKKHTSQKSHKDRTKEEENDQGVRKSPRIKASQSLYKMPTNMGENQDSRDTHSVQELRRSCRTPTKSEIVRGQSKNEIRYFEISDKNPILSKIVSPKKPKLDIPTDKASHHTSKSGTKTIELKKHTLNHTLKETKGVPILLLEESTMDGIDYHDDVTLDIGNHSKEEAVIEGAEGGEELDENSETDQSVEEGELSDSEEDEKIAMSELRQSGETSEKYIEVTPKKQKISLSKDTSGRSKISPVKFLASHETKSSYDGESSCKCSKSECIHTRLSISDRKQRKRYRSDSDTCSDSSLSRQKRRIRPDHPSVRKRSRSRDRIDSPDTRRHDRLDRKSPIHSHRRSPLRRRRHSRSRSASPLRGRRKRSRSLSPVKSRFVRKERGGLKSRHRCRDNSDVESPRSNRRNRTGSKERSVSPGRSHHRSSRSCRESNSESATDFSGKRSNRKKLQSDMSDEDLSSQKRRGKEKSLSDSDYEESSDEENERFSKLKSEKSRGNAKGRQPHENSHRSESGRIRHGDRNHSRVSSGYKVRERHRTRSRSRSPIRRRKRFRSDSGSEVETDGFEVADKKSVQKKCENTESPRHKRSRTGNSCTDSSNENFDKSRKR